MASTGLMLMALIAGARPASTPRTVSTATAPIAVQNPIWKWAVRTPSLVAASSAPERISTVNMIPSAPAVIVSTMLSLIIWPRIILGVAPMARRIPIYEVLSFTVTIMMFDTPMAPARRVPRPMRRIMISTPFIRLSIIVKILSELTENRAWSSSGSK